MKSLPSVASEGVMYCYCGAAEYSCVGARGRLPCSPDYGRSWREGVCEVAACREQWRLAMLLFLAGNRQT